MEHDQQRVNWRSHTPMKHIFSATIAVLLIAAADSTGQEAASGARETNRVNRVPDAVFIPTPQDVVDAMLELAGVRSSDVVYDLGCGDGRIVITAAKRYGCRSTGFDIDELRVEQSRENVLKAGLSDLVTIENRNVLKTDLRTATVITLYLTPKLNARLIPQFERMGPGSRIVAHESDIPGLRPDKVVEVDSKEDGRRHVIYLWKTPWKRND